MRKKRTPRQIAKDKAWDTFSVYIRLRDADINGYCTCISCGKRAYWKGEGMQAGHLIPGRYLNILFDEELVYAQCSGCNMGSGEQARYWINLKKKKGYTDEDFDKLKARKNVIKKMNISDFEDITEEYTDKIIGLCASKEIDCG